MAVQQMSAPTDLSSSALYIFGFFWFWLGVYIATGYVSQALPYVGEVYRKLSESEKEEWNMRGPSTVHAAWISVLSLYILQVDNLADDRLFGRSNLVSAVMLPSLGYMFADTATEIYVTSRKIGYVTPVSAVAHHVCSVLAQLATMLPAPDQMLYLSIVIASTEVTTPTLNLRWYLVKAGCSRAATILGVVLLAQWVFFRLVPCASLCFWLTQAHSDLVSSVLMHKIVAGHLMSWMMLLLNSFWFYLLVRGALKIVFGKNKGEKPE
eukprot:CAMPEP_0204392018 /NCGR_PEP_ID=MMETSP0469-20131031/61544_1 /ASSEMBLY_ACC=CAM_ASM_000384 /TAXON_ID=2969 /ORGANISM="Oxyrrhis marina" /LENGTH=265 /DNA_ID=CAMNT_0051385983 /DNA_START=9 /DNA_END=806 /DNA_ORIENTATION=+